ncbi:hypothetical protein [Clostridium saccharoperbutylacetonicum]|nr:hypothetical protein [Clostridium saccharoperbutylacetonicum]NSB29633.1 hypothetical protein [Clostridium saccharoperbutylacetonicum]
MKNDLGCSIAALVGIVKNDLNCSIAAFLKGVYFEVELNIYIVEKEYRR